MGVPESTWSEIYTFVIELRDESVCLKGVERVFLEEHVVENDPNRPYISLHNIEFTLRPYYCLRTTSGAMVVTVPSRV